MQRIFQFVVLAMLIGCGCDALPSTPNEERLQVRSRQSLGNHTVCVVEDKSTGQEFLVVFSDSGQGGSSICPKIGSPKKAEKE